MLPRRRVSMLRAIGSLSLAAWLGACGAGLPVPDVFPISEEVLRHPRAGDVAAMFGPRTVRGGARLGVVQPLAVGHCGLHSPIDFDGSLWNPVAGQDGQGNPLAQDVAEGAGSIVLLDPDTAMLTAADGAIVLLRRHAGPRAYFLCM